MSRDVEVTIQPSGLGSRPGDFDLTIRTIVDGVSNANAWSKCELTQDNLLKIANTIYTELDIDPPNGTRQILALLRSCRKPVSGRFVSEVLGISPTTANSRLNALKERGLVCARPSGRAILWTDIVTTNSEPDTA